MPTTSKMSTAEILNKLRLIEGAKVKRAAIILFGKDPNRFYPNVQVKIGRFGKDSTDLKFQEVIEGNLVHLLQEVPTQLNYKFLTRAVDFKGLHRAELDEYPIAALREMLLNALIHRTYMGAAVQIRVFDNSLSIWNEGTLPNGLDLASLKKEHNSRPRNPLIADACFKSGYIDSWGRGTLKIITACAEANLPEPEITEKDGGIQVTLYKAFSNQVGNQVGNQVESEKTIDKLVEAIKKVLQKEAPTEKLIQKYIGEKDNYSAEQLKVLNFCMKSRKRKAILEKCLEISNQTKNYNTFT